MPTEIAGFDEITDEQFTRMLLDQRTSHVSYVHPSMLALMAALAESDRPLLIRLKDTQTARSVRGAIMNVARHRGLIVQSVTGNDGLTVGVRRIGFRDEEEEENDGSHGERDAGPQAPPPTP